MWRRADSYSREKSGTVTRTVFKKNLLSDKDDKIGAYSEVNDEK